MVVDATVVRACDGAKFSAAIRDLQRLDLLGAMVGEAVLQVDASKRRRELAQIGRRRTDEARKLPEAPMGRRDRCLGIRKDERELLRIVAMSLDADGGPLDRPRPALLGPAFHRGVKLGQ